MKSVKIGFAPTRRSIFSAPDAVKYANLTRERLKELGVEFVDITDINEEGLFYDEADREKIQEKFRRENVKGIFFPHGTSERNMSVQGWQRKWGFRYSSGDRAMRDRMRTVCVSATASAVCSQPEKCCAVLAFRSPT